VMIVYYGEHGFYDHVAPPPLKYTAKGGQPRAFVTPDREFPGIHRLAARGARLREPPPVRPHLGPPVPGGAIHFGARLLGGRKSPPGPRRCEHLGRTARGGDSMAPPPVHAIPAPTVLGRSRSRPPSREMQKALKNAATEMKQ